MILHDKNNLSSIVVVSFVKFYKYLVFLNIIVYLNSYIVMT